MPDTRIDRTDPPDLTLPGIEDLQRLGRGGFGTVYSGWQPELRRRVAVKVLDAPASDPASAGRFRREGMAMGALSDHPNVVPVYATGTVGDRLYLVMPLLPDGSLEDQLASGPLSPDDVVRLGRGLADALAAAHAAGVLHRDVKPANVLWSPYGTPQLADFGVARVADATQTMTGSLTGTIAYAAPEVLEGQPATEASDVYSLGATMHAALRGRPPYQPKPDESPIAMAVRVLGTDPPDLREAGAPPALAAVVERAMARDVDSRLPTAAALRDALDGVDLDTTGAGPDDATVVAALPAGGSHDSTAVMPASGTADETRVAAAPAPARPLERKLPARREAGGRGGWVLAALAALVVLAGAALLFVDRDGTDGEAGTDPDAPSTSAPAETAETPPPDAEEPPPTEEPDTTEAEQPTQTTAQPAGSTADAVRDYYALMDAGRVDEGFARLSPAYQARTGEPAYRAFWDGIDGVEVLAVEGDDDTAAATLRYTRADGTTSTEDVRLAFVRDPDSGALLIDDYEVR